MDLKYHKLNNTIGYWKCQLVLSRQPLCQDNRVLMVELKMTNLVRCCTDKTDDA
jgi:hypothetical protein